MKMSPKTAGKAKGSLAEERGSGTADCWEGGNLIDDNSRGEAFALLDGYVQYDHNLPVNKYYDAGSASEVRARKAIARILRSGCVSGQILQSLADLFDPLSDNGRKLVFVRRHKGRPRDHIRNSAIASHVQMQVKQGAKISQALERTATYFDREDIDSVKKIWNRYRSYRLLDVL